jgi:hypothetical protein
MKSGEHSSYGNPYRRDFRHIVRLEFPAGLERCGAKWNRNFLSPSRAQRAQRKLRRGRASKKFGHGSSERNLRSRCQDKRPTTDIKLVPMKYPQTCSRNRTASGPPEFDDSPAAETARELPHPWPGVRAGRANTEATNCIFAVSLFLAELISKRTVIVGRFPKNFGWPDFQATDTIIEN